VNGQAPGADAAGSTADRLRRLRATLDMSQEQLARRLGVSFATVNRWEAGRTHMSARAARALGEFEAQAAADSPGAGPVPAAPSRFIGRGRELAELMSMLEKSRLVTVTGPGGVGKTRLVTEALRRRDPPGRATFIPLEPVRHPQSLIPAVASSLRVRDQAGVAILASVEAVLSATPRLIVLDGAEHLREEVALLAARLLAAVPDLRIVVTSRAVLGVRGEVCWPLPPLACPTPAAPVSEIARSDAVRLFMARASERLPGLSDADAAPRVIAELCRRLDCLPLAIELIAGWMGTFSVREILDQGAVLLASEPLEEDEFTGRSLGDVVRRSYDLLRPEQQRLLPALSVFAGPFTARDAAAVAADERGALARALRGLVDSSWLVVEHGAPNRFSMLETMRVFAAARLDEQDGAGAVRRRHAEHFAALARGSETGLAGPDCALWAARLEAALADLDVALRWAQEHGDTDLGLDMGAALWRWWLTSGQLAAGRDWLGRFLIHVSQRRDERSGRAFCSAAVLAAENGDYPEAVRLARIAVNIFDSLGMRERSAFAATVLGSAYRYLGERDAARRCFEKALNLRAELGDRRGVSVAMNNLALMALDESDFAAARANLEQALVIKRQLGDQQSLAIGLANLSDVLISTRELDAARRALAEASELAEDLANPQLTGLLAANRGYLAAVEERWADAARHYQAAALAHQQGGHAHDVVVALAGLGRAVYRLGRPDESARHLRAAEAMAAGIANPQRLADVRAALAEIGESADAAALPDGLTARQVDVLRLLAGGMSNKQIAGELHLSPVTVERHLATVYRKLSLGGRVEAARYAVTHGLAAPAR
jgi:predicted ATPase/DNA-binding CsgD family transcriptional regulator/DNA-binding XRE family transcriptional regulator/predicted negative regulator of RcsB-dependent stress response